MEPGKVSLAGDGLTTGATSMHYGDYVYIQNENVDGPL